MRVRLTTDRAWSGGLQLAGEVYDLPDREALSLLRTHQAEAVEDGPPAPPAPRPFKPLKRR